MALRGHPCSLEEAAQVVLQCQRAMAGETPCLPAMARSAASLLELHTGKHGKVSDKWEAYFPAYERHFGPFRNLPISLLEIGVQNGGSLEVWSDYFGQAEVFVGCDIDPACGQLRYDDPRIRVVVGDAGTPETRERILACVDSFDVIIDDGSHLSHDIIAAFLSYYPRLRPGGVYVVEDTHALYRNNPGAGILSRTSAHEFFKLCAEMINAEHWLTDLHPATLFSTFFAGKTFPQWLAEGAIESVEFRSSMVVIHKPISRAQLGKRIVSGKEATVFPGSIRHIHGATAAKPGS